MKNLLRSIAMAFTMFSRVPMPQVEWKPENMRDTLAAFPLVGVLLGLVLAGWYALSEWLLFDQFLFAAGVALLPVLYTGGIHLDGFCDTGDALASRADTERKLEILKDPHVGAFAVIGVSAYLLAYFAFGTELIFDKRDHFYFSDSGAQPYGCRICSRSALNRAAPVYWIPCVERRKLIQPNKRLKFGFASSAL
jgi:adenosylcobinamide-GDP ribazoletransferase